MRILEFTVRQQRLLKKHGCSFSGLVAGSVGYLRAKFNFTSSDWDECPAKAASFWKDGKEYARLLDEDGCCLIPPEALTGEEFSVTVHGARPGYMIGTNEIIVRQEVR